MKKKQANILESKLETLLNLSKSNNDLKKRVVIVEDNTRVIMDVNNITRLESIGNYTAFYLSDGRKLTSTKTLKVYATQLPTNIFFRIYRSHLINIHFVKSFTAYPKPTVTMIDDTELEISREKKKEFAKLMDTI